MMSDKDMKSWNGKEGKKKGKVKKAFLPYAFKSRCQGQRMMASATGEKEISLSGDNRSTFSRVG
jgi:hypothetical protein